MHARNSTASQLARILFIKSGPRESRGCAFVLSSEGVYTRRLQSQEEIEEVLEEGRFELVLNDARAHPEDPFLFVQRLRQHQLLSPIVLLCPTLELDGVVRAIRHGVNDILSPPFDFTALHERALELIRMQASGSTPNVTVARWFEIAQFLAETEAPALAETAAPPSARRRKPEPAPEPVPDLSRAKRDRLAAELAVERAARAAAAAARDEAMAEIESLRHRVAERNGSAPVDLAGTERMLAELTRREESLSAGEAACQAAAEQLTQERQDFERRMRNEREDLEQRQAALAQREAELDAARQNAERAPGHDDGSASASAPSAPGGEIEPSFSGMGRRAAELAAMVAEMVQMRQQLIEQRKAQEAAASLAAEALRDRERALAQREAAATAEHREAHARLEADRAHFAGAQRALAEEQGVLEALTRDLENRESQLAERDKFVTEATANLAEAETRLAAKQQADAAEDAARDEKDAGLARREAEAQQRAADLDRRQASLDAAGQELTTAKENVTHMQRAAATMRGELDALAATLNADAERLTQTAREQARLAAELEERRTTLSAEAAELAQARSRLDQQTEELRQQQLAIAGERAALDHRCTAIENDATALAERTQAFEDRRRQFREAVLSAFES
jgi:FixJ family two-component response regulator/chromosome segregation ATPase